MLTVGSLFSGIGGIELGLEMTGGFRTLWHSEIEPYACEVLAKHWPGVPNLGDITKINWNEIDRPDVICGGFPCQDISVAGKGAGIAEGTRSGLWFEFRRAIGVLRPRYVIIENVSALVIRGLDIVLADLAQAGYDAEWADIRAADVGAPHRRERIFIVAYPDSGRPESGRDIKERCLRTEERSFAGEEQQRREREPGVSAGDAALADPANPRLSKRGQPGQPQAAAQTGTGLEPGVERRCEAVAHASDGLQRRGAAGQQEQQTSARARISGRDGSGGVIYHPIDRSPFWDDCDYIRGRDGALRAVKSGVRLLDDGVPRRVAKLKALGNAVVPQCAEYVGRCLLSYHIHRESDV